MKDVIPGAALNLVNGGDSQADFAPPEIDFDSDAATDLLFLNVGQGFGTLCADMTKLLFEDRWNAARVNLLRHFNATPQALDPARRDTVLRELASCRSVRQVLDDRSVGASELIAVVHTPELLEAVLAQSQPIEGVVPRPVPPLPAPHPEAPAPAAGSTLSPTYPSSVWQRIGHSISTRRLAKVIAVAGVAAIITMFVAWGVGGAILASDRDAMRSQLSVVSAESSKRLSELEKLRQDIEKLGIDKVTIPGKDLITTDRSSIRFSVLFNPKFVSAVWYRFGNEKSGRFETATQETLSRDDLTGLTRFELASPDLRGKNLCVTAEIRFVPDTESLKQFPEFFAPEKLHYVRTFYLGASGIVPDLEPIAVTGIEGRDGALCQPGESDREGAVRGRRVGDTGHWPVVVVQSLAAGQSPWVQDHVPEIDEGGGFRTRAKFGDASTPAGTQFVVQIFLAPSKAEAERISVGRQSKPMPSSWMKSRPLTVTLK